MSDKETNILKIQQYLEGKLDPGQMHELEKQALDDPFLADALEGYAYSKKPVQHELSILQRQLEERIQLKQDEKDRFHFTWQRLSVAAAAGLMFITISILFLMNNNRNKDQKNTPATSAAETRANEDALFGDSTVSEEIVLAPKNPNNEINPDSRIAANATPELSSQATFNSEPVTGWPAYREYLARNIRYSAINPRVSGDVIVAFKVDSSGKPVGVRILKGLNPGSDVEAIRLIRDGAAWKVNDFNQVSEIQATVPFRP